MPAIISLWIWTCAYLNCVGWSLSALHQLNAGGYAAALTLGLGVLLAWWRKNPTPRLPQIHWQKYPRRFRKPLPLAFLIFAAMAFLGGALYAPTNYDALTYRLPRMLNWLGAGHWFWIPTTNDRMNYSATAWEWTAMPLLALLRSDRSLFLINALGYFLMPGMLFSVFRQLGVARRVAWFWMWLLPLGYGYATQAGSIGNDFTGMLFGLASVYFGLRARRSRTVNHVWPAILAAALMTGTKISNLPLLLPCLVAVWPALPRLCGRWITSIAVISAAVVVSAAPTLVLNQHHTGSWNGDPQNRGQMQIKDPSAALLGNGLLLLQQSLMPPVLLGANSATDCWNKKIPLLWQEKLAKEFPRYSLNRLNELPQEESAGLGLGITGLLLLPVVVGIVTLSRKALRPGFSLVALAACFSIFFFMANIGSEATARLLLPYYPLGIVLILLLPNHERLSRLRFWKTLAMLAACSALPAVVLSPSRPLFPAGSVSEWLLRHYPDQPAAQRTATVYLAYAHRNDALASLRAGLPVGISKVGFLAGPNDTDYSLWRPFGLRQIEHLQSASGQPIKVPANVEWLVIKRIAWEEASPMPLETWAALNGAKITLSVPIVTLVSGGEQTWCVLQLEKP